MTPTPGAPVTVEQIDWVERFAKSPLTTIEEHDAIMKVVRFARHRLAALASAPAMDVELHEALQQIADKGPEKGSGESYKAWARTIARRAIARPRAAVGEREAQHLRNRVMYDDRFQTACQRYAHDGGTSAAIAAAAILALQFPPAKAEGVRDSTKPGLSSGADR